MNIFFDTVCEDMVSVAEFRYCFITEYTVLDNHDGGCLCGKVRYTVYGQPVRAGVCHCRYCQLRAGSAFGTLVYFSLEKLQLRSGKLSEYHFRTEMGRTWKNEFCSTCGLSLIHISEPTRPY